MVYAFSSVCAFYSIERSCYHIRMETSDQSIFRFVRCLYRLTRRAMKSRRASGSSLYFVEHRRI